MRSREARARRAHPRSEGAGPDPLPTSRGRRPIRAPGDAYPGADPRSQKQPRFKMRPPTQGGLRTARPKGEPADHRPAPARACAFPSYWRAGRQKHLSRGQPPPPWFSSARARLPVESAGCAPINASGPERRRSLPHCTTRRAVARPAAHSTTPRPPASPRLGRDQQQRPMMPCRLPGGGTESAP